MNIFSEETDLLRSHYFINKTKQSPYAMRIRVGDTYAYIQKECRGYDYKKITHTQIVSMLRVLGFSYLGFKVSNLEEILQQAKSSLFATATREEVFDTGCCILSMDGKIKRDMRIDYQTITSSEILPIGSIRERYLWPCTKPIIEKMESRTFDYNTKYIELADFVTYINNIFSANISTIIQGPLLLVYTDIINKYTLYKMTNNLNSFSKNTIPSVFDFLVTDSLIEYIKNL
ncbi:hypothetical protein PvNV_045 [Penaeus vannamei nudivirus]|nr:hypothetical protein PvSNPV_045 [Penaeus vannamei nucleopolyhedrovirus]